MKWSELLPGDVFFSTVKEDDNKALTLVITSPKLVDDSLLKWKLLFHHRPFGMEVITQSVINGEIIKYYVLRRGVIIQK